jgi:hypothetical protein
VLETIEWQKISQNTQKAECQIVQKQSLEIKVLKEHMKETD